jgi:DNA primase
MRIPENKVEEIYNAIDIVEVISDYLPLKKRGGNYWGLSPFANEKTPSFAVSPSKGIYKDFSTGKGGNAVNFLMEMEGYTYPEALRHLAKKYNIELPEEDESDAAKEGRDKRQSLLIVNEFASKWFHDQLLNSDEGRNIGLSYFKERGILQKTIEDFQLGYAPDEWQALTDAAQKKQHNPEFLQELGLVSTSEKSGKLFDRFRGRVMFPITNHTGKVVGFGGRVLTSEKQMAKYINSSESVIYNKSQILYGLYHAKQHVRNEDQCILTEGYMDTIVLHQNGIQNVVASSGTALTPDQIRLIRRFTKNVLMIYDGDAAGIKAAMRGIDLLLQEGMNAQVLVLPDGHDPDSYIGEHGSTAFREIAKKEAKTFLDFKLDILSEQLDHTDPAQQAELIRAISDTLARLPDMLKRELYVKNTAERLDISEALMAQAVHEAMQKLGKQLRKEEQRQQRFEQKQAQTAEVKPMRSFETLDLAKQEKELLRILLNHHDKSFDFVEGDNLEEAETIRLIDFFMEELEGLPFENTVFETLKEDVFEVYRKGKTFQIHHYLGHPDPAITSLTAELLSLAEAPSENWRKKGVMVPPLDHDLSRAVQSAMYHYQRRKVGKLLDELKDKMKVMTQEEENELFEMFIYLTNMRKEVAEKLGIVVEK